MMVKILRMMKNRKPMIVMMSMRMSKSRLAQQIQIALMISSSSSHVIESFTSRKGMTKITET